MSFKCNKCTRLFDSNDKYIKHINSNRCKEPYICELCNYTTNRKNDYTKHLNTNKCKNNHRDAEKKRLYTCSDCNKSFRDNHHLSRHMNRKTPCAINSIVNNNNTTNNNSNNTMMNSNNTIIINAHDPSAFLKGLNKVDRAIYNNVLQSFSIDAPESIERMNEISESIPYKQPKLLTKERLPTYSDEQLEFFNNEAYRSANNSYFTKLLERSFFNTSELEYTPFFKIPNSKKIAVKHNNDLKELNYDIISQLVININHKMTLLEKEDAICLYRIKNSIDEVYNQIRMHFIHHVKNYKRL